jgi:hypothetical protein
MEGLFCLSFLHAQQTNCDYEVQLIPLTKDQILASALSPHDVNSFLFYLSIFGSIEGLTLAGQVLLLLEPLH